MATVFVIMLHCNFSNIYNHESSVFPFGCFVEALCYCAVPLFFMISGATILDYSEKYSTKVFFIKRIKKVAIPFMFWSLISIVYAFAISSPSRPTGVVDALIGIVTAKYVGIYWYMPCLMLLYVFYPLFSCYKGNKRIAAKRIIIISFIVICVGFILSLAKGISFDKVYLLYFFYVTSGYYLNTYEIPTTIKKMIYSLAVLGFLFLFFGTLLSSYITGSYNTLFLSYLNIPCCLYSVGLFLFIKEWSPNRNKVSTKGLDIISSCSFGIYLTHWYFISILDKLFSMVVFDINSILIFVIKVICTFGLAFMLSWLFKKSKILRKIIP